MLNIKRLEKEDLKEINEIRNQYLHLIRQWKPHNLKEQEQWFENTHDLYFGIFWKNKLNGAVGITNIDLINRKCELSLITKDYLKKELAQGALNFIQEYAFNKLNIHKIYITIYEFDEKKIKFFTQNNYVKEVEFREDILYQNKYWKHYYYSLLENEWVENI